MNAPETTLRKDSLYLAETHEVINVARDLVDYNLYEQDAALKEAVRREGADWAEAELSAFGARIGTAEYLELGVLANRVPPELDTHDRFGNRIDLVRFHPAYHTLMKTAIEQGLHSSPWTEPRVGAHVARAAGIYLHSQVEAGHQCPVTMTFAAVPTLRTTPQLAALWEPRITARVYDPRNVPDTQKKGLTIGMAMTEKQGGSDVRANTTRAYPVGLAQGPGEAYELVGHKFFVSAPMCDAFLALAQAPGGLSCFLLPRWRPDGSKNPLQVLRLKRKMGNVSNASSETELRGALAWMVGEEGRGVRTIIEMVAMTRFDCMVGSSAGQRAAVAQALHHCSMRSAFGKLLNQQPLMRNVLADLVLETEGSLALTMRIARALDSRAADEHEELLVRLVTAVGKYWICKRTPQHAYESMECIGGSGVMEDSPFPRLFRESPVNAIWEGSGNVQCLDVLRAMQKMPATVDAFFAELAKAKGANAALDRYVAALRGEFADLADLEYRARDVVDRMALAIQAALLVQHAPAMIADAFCASRLEAAGHHNYGALPRGVDCEGIIARATPRA
ncbi:MAG TPA: isovaleryl-CoA dehydrogenase [Zeimonas sp.]|nr:isovaleryl-CoA dehydrogenase [Zeimonas sp.]